MELELRSSSTTFAFDFIFTVVCRFSHGARGLRGGARFSVCCACALELHSSSTTFASDFTFIFVHEDVLIIACRFSHGARGLRGGARCSVCCACALELHSSSLTFAFDFIFIFVLSMFLKVCRFLTELVAERSPFDDMRRSQNTSAN